ncbi:MAG: ABC transporter permease [Candidatus Woesearchaeota archaeon]
MKLFQIIKKNIRILVKSKSTIITMLLGPLLVMFLLGLAFDHANIYRISIGVFSQEKNNLTESFIKKLETRFKVIEYQNQESCVESIKLETINTCIIFPENMSIEENKTNDIQFYVDYSKVNLVWMIRDVILSSLEERSEEITEDLTKQLIQKIENIEKEVKEKQPVLIEMTTLNTILSENVKDMQSRLNSLDVSFNPNSFRANEIKDQISKLRYLSFQTIDLCNYSLNQIKSSVSNSNLSSAEKTQITNLILDTQKDLNNIKNNIKNIYNDQNSGELNILISNLITKISEVEKKFETINKTLNNVSKSLDYSKSKLGESLLGIIKLQEGFNRINKEISGIEIRSAEKIVRPITITIKPISYKKTHLNFLFPTLITIVLMFVSILLSSLMVVIEKNSPAYFRNYISPTHQSLFSIATLVTTIIVVIPQFLILFGIAMLYVKTEIIGSFWSSLIIALLSTITFALIGMLISQFFRREETTITAALIVSTLFLFLSNTIMPIESMNLTLAKIANYSPFVISEFLFRHSLIFQTKLSSVILQIELLCAYIFVLLLLVLSKDFVRKSHKRYKLKE